jgi:DNA-binding GntR family transcriptional regulator
MLSIVLVSYQALPSPLVLRGFADLLELCQNTCKGDSLPIENELANNLSISRTTVRKLLLHLAANEWIQRSGRGWKWSVNPSSIRLPSVSPNADGREETARRHLIRLLASGKLPPGSSLSELSVARALGMTTVPVREAMRSIENLGLVVRHARRSWTTNKLDAQQVGELMCMRRLVELHCLDQLKTKPPSGFSKQLQTIKQTTCHILNEKKFNLQNGLRIDRCFHETLLEFANNRFLIRQSRFIYLLIEYEFAHSHIPHSRLINGLQDHVRILSLLLSGNFKTARTELKLHLDKAEKMLMQACCSTE